MDESAIAAAYIDLYKDIAKIGIPALMGFLTGLIPYCLEKLKLKNTTKNDKIQFRRNQVNSLIDSISIFSGCLFRYTSLLLSSIFGDNEDEDLIEQIKEAGQNLLENEHHLKKAMAIAGILADSEILECLVDFDLKASIAVRALSHKGKGKPDDVIEDLKKSEKDLMISLNKLLF